MACFQSPITHPCIAAFVFQSLCREERGTFVIILLIIPTAGEN